MNESPLILQKILAKKRDSLNKAKSRTSLDDLKSKIAELPEPLSFIHALVRTPDTLALIAELKKASPSKGLIRPDFETERFARIYEAHGAACISVLTEEVFFQGAIEYLDTVRNCIKKIPILRKDFIFDPYQIYEARAHQADAVLLIASALERNQIEDLYGLASELGLDSLVEVHNLQELDNVLYIGAPLIGINNRNLDTLKVDIETTLAMLPDIPEDRVVVTESGINTRADVERFLPTRVAAMLVGTAIMKSEDAGAKIDELIYGFRKP